MTQPNTVLTYTIRADSKDKDLIKRAAKAFDVSERNFLTVAESLGLEWSEEKKKFVPVTKAGKP